jgi:choline kinase
MADMLPRAAVVLAAHDVPGLRPLTLDRPMSLIEIGGRPVIDHQLASLARCGIEAVCVVAGHQGRALRDHIGGRAGVVHDADYATSDRLGSLQLASGWIRAGAVIVSGDVLFAPRLLDHLLHHGAPDALIVARARDGHAHGPWITLAGTFVDGVHTNEDRPAHAVTAVGLVKVGAEGARRLLDVLAVNAHGGSTREAGTFDAIAALAQSWPVVAVDAEGAPWTRVRSIEDLTLAAKVVAPSRCCRGRDAKGGTRR